MPRLKASDRVWIRLCTWSLSQTLLTWAHILCSRWFGAGSRSLWSANPQRGAPGLPSPWGSASANNRPSRIACQRAESA